MERGRMRQSLINLYLTHLPFHIHWWRFHLCPICHKQFTKLVLSFATFQSSLSQKQGAMQSFRFLRIPLFPPNALFFVAQTSHLPPVKPISRIPTKNFSSQMGSSPSSSSSKLLFRQLFEKESSTYTYLLADVSHPEKPALVIFLSNLSLFYVLF